MRGSSSTEARSAQYLAYKATEGRPCLETAEFIAISRRLHVGNTTGPELVVTHSGLRDVPNDSVWYRVVRGNAAYSSSDASTRRSAHLYTEPRNFTQSETEVLEQIQRKFRGGGHVFNAKYTYRLWHTWSEYSHIGGRLLVYDESRETTVFVQYIRHVIERFPTITHIAELRQDSAMVRPGQCWDDWYKIWDKEFVTTGCQGVLYIHRKRPKVLQQQRDREDTTP